MNKPASQEVDVEFIRLLFTDSVQEEVAYRWARRLGGLIAWRVMELRPGPPLRR